MKPLQRGRVYPPPTYLYDEKTDPSDHEEKATNTMKIFTILDKTAKVWSTPFFQPNETFAIREVKNEVNRKSDNNNYYLYPSEYDLHCIGSWNTETGTLVQDRDTSLICNLSALKNKENTHG